MENYLIKANNELKKLDKLICELPNNLEYVVRELANKGYNVYNEIFKNGYGERYIIVNTAHLELYLIENEEYTVCMPGAVNIFDDEGNEQYTDLDINEFENMLK